MAANPVLNDKRFDQIIEANFGGAPIERTMTLGGTLSAFGVLFVLLLGTAAFGWSQVTQTTSLVLQNDVLVEVNATSWPRWTFIAALVSFGFAMLAFFKPKTAPFAAPIYAIGMGCFLGAISAIYNQSWDGIVVQAVFATLSVVFVMFLLYVTRIVKVTPKFVLITVAATGGIFVMYMLTWVVSLFGANIAFWNSPSLLGIGISVVIVIVAAMNLALDFAFIETSVAAGNVPRRMEWVAALGVTVTIVWLYLEILRLLSLLRR